MKIQIDEDFFEVDKEVGEYIRWLETDNLKQEQEKRMIVDRVALFSNKLMDQLNELDVDVYNVHNNIAAS